MLVNVWLVQPSAGKVNAVRYLALLAQCCRRACRQTGLGDACAHYKLNAVLLAELFLARCVTVAVYEEDIGFQTFYILLKVEHAAAAVDESILNITDSLNHVQTLLLCVYCLAVLEFTYCSIGTNSNVEVTVSSSFLEKCHVTRVEHVVASRNKYFLAHCRMLNSISQLCDYAKIGILFI